MMLERYNHDRHWSDVESLWEARGCAGRVPEHSVSPFGAVIYDEEGMVMAGWVYLAMGCSVCFVERLVSRKGLILEEARAAGRAIFEFLRNMAVLHGYKDVYAHLDRRGLEPELEDLGFTRHEGEGVLMHKQLQR